MIITSNLAVNSRTKFRPFSPKNSWICQGLQIGLTRAFLMLVSDFKHKASFKFLIKNYTGHVFCFFAKYRDEVVWLLLVFSAILLPELIVVQ